ncbi:Glycosyltransferase family 11 [uncultured virus]|nr:Glycosyltransferase family 11 [uncultured virus]
MDVFLLLGCVLLIFIIIVYLGILFLLYAHKNPTAIQPETIYVGILDLASTPVHLDFTADANSEQQLNSNINKSTITHSYLGTRGDMGNQIFQLACVIAAGKRSQANIVFPTKISLLPIIELFDLTKFEWKNISIDATFYEYDNYENIIVPDDGRNYDINGYRQAYKYFEDSAPLIRSIFTPRASILEPVRQGLPPEYIAIHIRKGDYVKLIHKIPLLREFKQCELDYYKAGIRKLREIHPDCPLLVCTDSPKWATPILAELDSKAILAPVPSDISPKFSDFCTLYLANAVVMSNSTYSWWGSYLNPNRTIIAPTPWWDPDGLIGTGLALSGPYLHHPEWWLLDATTGKIIREPHSTIGELPDNNHETLNLYRLIRGMLL